MQKMLKWGMKETFHYINYVLFDRTVKAKTCEKYLSGIRMHHLSKGYDVPALRPAIVSLILKGKENWENIQSKLNQKHTRITVTVTIMKLLKRRIRKINWSEAKKNGTCILQKSLQPIYF